MTFGEEKGIHFAEPTKNDIFQKTSERVRQDLEWVTKFPIEERPNLALGRVFETLAVNERLINHPENEKQKNIRTVVEVLYQRAEISLGENWPSKPDFVSIIFDKNGHMIIDEIVEMKTSNMALRDGINKPQSQPQNAIKTIEKIVDLVNSMINTVEFSDLEVIKALKPGKEKYRKSFLEGIFNRIKGQEIVGDISFSDKLQYHVILPEDAGGTPPNFSVLTKDKKQIAVIITKSQFTRQDIFNIIDHYAETP